MSQQYNNEDCDLFNSLSAIIIYFIYFNQMSLKKDEI